MVQSVEKDSEKIRSECEYRTDEGLTLVTIMPLRIWQHASIAPDSHRLDTEIRLSRSKEAKRTAELLEFIGLHTLQKRARVGLECHQTT